MKHFFTLLCFSSWCAFLSAQNLVPNPSFEDHTACPNNGGQIDYALYWTNPLIGGGSSPDYFNVCGIPAWNVPSNAYGYEPARTGVAYSAICTATYNAVAQQQNNFREYLQVELLDSLKSGKKYCFSFFVSACDSVQYVSNDIGIYFSRSEIHDTTHFPTYLNYTPQIENDSTNDLSSRIGWTEVSGQYTAVGGEKYIVIGNFKDSTTTVATFLGGKSYLDYAVYYVDDVFLVSCDSLSAVGEMNHTPLLNIYPNPSSGNFFLEKNNIPVERIEIYNSIGEIVLTEREIETNDKIPINLTNQADGIYLIGISNRYTRYTFKIIKN